MVSVDDIIDFEDGRMSQEREIVFFADLIKTGMVWTLRCFYGRAAQAYIEAGYVNPDGTLTLRGMDAAGL